MANQNIRAHAFNAIAPVVNKAGYWLPLSVRQRVADGVLAAVEAAGYTVIPTAEYERLTGGAAAT